MGIWGSERGRIVVYHLINSIQSNGDGVVGSDATSGNYRRDALRYGERSVSNPQGCSWPRSYLLSFHFSIFDFIISACLPILIFVCMHGFGNWKLAAQAHWERRLGRGYGETRQENHPDALFVFPFHLILVRHSLPLPTLIL